MVDITNLEYPGIKAECAVIEKMNFALLFNEEHFANELESDHLKSRLV